MIKGREIVLKVVHLNLAEGQRINRILQVLNIPKSIYYFYVHWKKSPTAIRRQFIKEKILNGWLKYPMHGYPRLTILVNQEFKKGASTRLVYQLIRELGIQSRMITKWKKPKTHTEVKQRPNLIKKLVDPSKILLTDITYIQVNQKWLFPFFVASLVISMSQYLKITS